MLRAKQYIEILIIALLNLADIWNTELALRNGAKEYNLLMRWLQSFGPTTFIVVKMSLMVAVVGLVLLRYKENYLRSQIFTGVIFVFVILVTFQSFMLNRIIP